MSTPEFRIIVYGEREVAQDFEDAGEAAIDTRPAMEEIYLAMLDIEQEIFSSEGAHGGHEKWKPLAFSTLKDRQRDGQHQGILHATGRLFRSMTEYRSSEQFVRITRNSIAFSSRRPWAFVHQQGGVGTNVPQRKFVFYNDVEARSFAREISRHILRQFKHGTVT